jgi:hypothetical protein
MQMQKRINLLTGLAPVHSTWSTLPDIRRRKMPRNIVYPVANGTCSGGGKLESVGYGEK